MYDLRARRARTRRVRVTYLTGFAPIVTDFVAPMSSTADRHILATLARYRPPASREQVCDLVVEAALHQPP